MEKVHELNLTDRQFLNLIGVRQVVNFDDKIILLETEMGLLNLKGEDLHIVQLDLESGKMVVKGLLCNLEYIEDRGKEMKERGKSILEKLFK